MRYRSASRALCQCKRFIGNILPGAQILSSGSMQKDDSALNVLPAVQAVLSIVSSLTRKMEVLDRWRWWIGGGGGSFLLLLMLVPPCFTTSTTP